ncbi:tryptophan 7-halogenase [Chryseobacterium sp.]|uniref:flavin-dependent monooxygenase QhpG n=1 Tax=Chryseobacterium sp. TaxID=1871047 RepID=UPI0025BB8BF8|nr:tryptophan 7-halogenase [Chryseobacterium sp.]MBV8327586.1 tryptophan 7-halogenase [Chryseobacterium sp.]
MKESDFFDVLIIGGGPAGSCAALRLLALGYHVGLIEQQIFPRHQIGESLSSGIRNIFEYLEAGHLLAEHSYINALPAQIIWENAGEENIEFRQGGDGIMVDRGKLDADMLQLAVLRGMRLFQPARPESFQKENSCWKVGIRENNLQKELYANFILDARGRTSSRISEKIITASSMVALYTNTEGSAMPHCTLVEAQQSGWLWGSPLPDGKFRMMAFMDPEDLKKENYEQVFLDRIASSLLFAKGVKALDFSGIKSCSVMNYSHYKPWEDHYIRIGEAAFTLDPLSSTGVEKAMRFSLQAVIAINTVLKSGHYELARTYYEDQMASSVIRHLVWTAGYYESAWPESVNRFWNERSKLNIISDHAERQFCNKLKLKLDEVKKSEKNKITYSGISDNQDLSELWYKKIRISSQITQIQTVCVEDDRLHLKNAISHPLLERELAYMDNIELIPLLAHLENAHTFGEMIYSWSQKIPFEKASQIGIRLCDLGVVELS